MSDYFRRIDTMLASNTMPDEYKNTLSHIYCNDCEKKSYTPYHFLYHKCQHCNGYNSKLLSTMSSQQSDLDSNSSSDSAALNPNSV
ncbi:zinc-ribbon-domain-containing protein [Globomyces pollinis-pini]|nr:zinc-ribbon-domain-containing protein [Globomyces pollinis-pini]